MNDRGEIHYDDDKLNGLDIAELIVDEWQSGRHQTIAQVTSAVHHQRSELPRSVVFWLAYHTLLSTADTAESSPPLAQAWPQR